MYCSVSIYLCSFCIFIANDFWFYCIVIWFGFLCLFNKIIFVLWLFCQTLFVVWSVVCFKESSMGSWKNMCLCLLDGIFCRHQLNPFALRCSLTVNFLCWFLFWMVCLEIRVVHSSHYYYYIEICLCLLDSVLRNGRPGVLCICLCLLGDVCSG